MLRAVLQEAVHTDAFKRYYFEATANKNARSGVRRSFYSVSLTVAQSLATLHKFLFNVNGAQPC